MKLQTFVDKWNKEMLECTASDGAFEVFADSMYDAMKDVWLPQPRNYVGLSQIHKPVCLTLLDKHGLRDKGNKTMAGTTHLLTGHYYEALLLFWMLDNGYVNITDMQKEIELHGLKGHIDFFLPDEDMVVDVKSMSMFYYRKFVGDTKEDRGYLCDDDRGYVTQVLAYQMALGCERACILAINKATNELSLIEITDDAEYLRYDSTVDSRLIRKRIKGVCQVIDQSDTIEDVFDYPLEIVCNPLNKKVKYVPDNCKYDSRINYWVERDKKGNVVHQYDEEEVRKRIMEDYHYGGIISDTSLIPNT